MKNEDEEEILKEFALVMQQLNIQSDVQPQLPMQEYQEKLLQLLSDRIRYWMQHDFEHLLGLMYRIDIGETAFRKALSSDEPSRQLARLVMHREMQKAKTRILYRKNKL